MNLTIPILILLSIFYYLWLVMNRSYIRKKADPRLVERILSNPDNSRSGFQKIKEMLTKEGTALADIKRAILATYYQKQGNKIFLVPIILLLICVTTLIRKYLFPSLLGVISIFVVAVIMIWLIFFYFGKNKD